MPSTPFKSRSTLVGEVCLCMRHAPQVRFDSPLHSNRQRSRHRHKSPIVVGRGTVAAVGARADVKSPRNHSPPRKARTSPRASTAWTLRRMRLKRGSGLCRKCGRLQRSDADDARGSRRLETRSASSQNSAPTAPTSFQSLLAVVTSVTGTKTYLRHTACLPDLHQERPVQCDRLHVARAPARAIARCTPAPHKRRARARRAPHAWARPPAASRHLMHQKSERLRLTTQARARTAADVPPIRPRSNSNAGLPPESEVDRGSPQVRREGLGSTPRPAIDGPSVDVLCRSPLSHPRRTTPSQEPGGRPGG